MSDQVRRFAAIDHATGYVQGATHNRRQVTDDAVGPAVEILEQIDPQGRTEAMYEECALNDARALVHVYAIGDDVVIEDGQDAATIAAVESGRYIGSVRPARRASFGE